MKNKFFPTFLTLATLMTGTCLAVQDVTEDFSKEGLDGFRWYQFRPAKGRLVQTNGKLNFQVKGKPTVDDFASIELLFNQAEYFENWEMIVDFSNTAKMKKHAGCGFMIFNGLDRSDYIYMHYYSSYGIDAGFFDNGQFTRAPQLSMRAVVPIGAVRVRYDTTTGLMTFSASMKSKEQGYSWKKIGTFASDIGRVQGDYNADWGISTTDSSSSAYGFQLFGSAESSKVPLGQVTIDNFSLRQLPFPPSASNR